MHSPQQWLAPQQRQCTRSIGNLAFARHAQCLFHRHEVDFYQLGRLGVRFAQLDAGGEIDISNWTLAKITLTTP